MFNIIRSDIVVGPEYKFLFIDETLDESYYNELLQVDTNSKIPAIKRTYQDGICYFINNNSFSMWMPNKYGKFLDDIYVSQEQTTVGNILQEWIIFNL